MYFTVVCYFSLDEAIQRQPNVRSHTIIEAHPDIYAEMIRRGWDKKPGVKAIFHFQSTNEIA